ncbi:MAG: hypothetical protein SOT07_03105 [Paludibacteraceae bacterium]|nr:hypothetical protein [Paludibacteraceae bacterium]
MKKIQFWTLTLAVVAMVSCKNEEVRVYENTAAADIAGTYSGTWSIVDDKGNLSEGAGTVEFAPVENEPYVVTMTFASEALSLSAATRANVTHAGDELVFYNNNALALLPDDAGEDAAVPAFQGRVKTDGSTTFNYSLKTGKGKKAKVNKYTFVGTR